ncbi:MAG: right-handed parallel beta-helix repeat-containing protein [Planctomycetaceae bacterium]|jgi:hypothetical protein|nr:right-handed parallel beta-helix repeat-containing protein [Planctomycetaceae bacterium]
MKKQMIFCLTTMFSVFCFMENPLSAQIEFDDIALSVYVSPTGDDTNSGTAEKPFKTVQRAQEKLRTRQIAQKGNKEVHLLAGEYVLTEPIKFTPEDGGSVKNDYQQVFYEGHDAVLSGGEKITGFQKADSFAVDNVVVADIPGAKDGKWTFRDLYVNDRRAVRARFPNEGFLRVKHAGEDRRTNFFFNAEDGLKSMPDLEQAELVFLHDWSLTRTPIKFIDAEKSQMTVPSKIGGDSPFWAIDGFEPHARYFLENSLAYLDAPGEWYLDTKAGKLYYKLREGETAETIHVIAPRTKQLLIVEGTQENPVENLHFIGIHFAHSAFDEKPQKTYWGIQAASYSSPAEHTKDASGANNGSPSFIPADAAVQYDYAYNCTLDACTFRHLGENGLWFRKSCYANNVNKCRFEDIGANGFMIGTHNNSDTSRCNNMTFSTVTKTGQTLYGAVGIWIGLTENSVIDRCEIFDTPYTGISLGWIWNDSPSAAKENMVLGCHLHHNMQILSDGGAIYTLGRQAGSRLAFNRIHDIPLNAGRAESNGLFLDEGTSDFTIDYNLITDTARSPLRFHQAKKSNYVENNFFTLETPETPTIRYNSTPEENILLKNNTTLPQTDKEKLQKTYAETTQGMFFDYKTQ